MKETVRPAEGMELDLRKLLLACLRRWWLILLAAAVFGGGALGYTLKFVTPLYRAGITVYVNNVRSGERIDYISGSNLQASQQLVNTYSNIIRSDTVLGKVAEAAGGDYTPETLRRLLTTAQIGETELFNVYLVHPDPAEAARLANAVANVAPAEIEGFVEGSSAKIIDYAAVPTERFSPSYGRAAALGALIGCVLAFLYIALRCLLDVRIKNEEDLAALCTLPLLAQIPGFEAAAAAKKRPYATPYAAVRRGE